MKDVHVRSSVAVLTAALLLSACGGGGGDINSSGSSLPSTQNLPSGPDTTAPTVNSTSATSNVPVSTTVSANFNEPVNCSTVSTTTFRINSGAVTGTVTCSGSTVRFTPSPSLAYNTTYSARLTGGTAGIRDLAGNALASNYTWNFTTVASAASATNYFNWGVENNTTSIGNLLSYFGNTSRNCTVAHSGSCSMRMNIIGNDNGNQQLGAELNLLSYPFNFVGGPEIYYRWWMRIEPGFRWGNGTAKTKSSRTGGGPISSNSTTAQGYTGYIMSYGFLIGECGSAGCRLANGAINDDSNLYIPYDFRTKDDGQWHEYIVKVKPNSSPTCTPSVNCDAEFEAWVDGVSVGQYNNFKLHSDVNHTMVEGWGGWMVTPYFQLNGTASDGGTIYVDDFSTDTVWNSLI